MNSWENSLALIAHTIRTRKQYIDELNWYLLSKLIWNTFYCANERFVCVFNLGACWWNEKSRWQTMFSLANSFSLTLFVFFFLCRCLFLLHLQARNCLLLRDSLRSFFFFSQCETVGDVSLIHSRICVHF